MNANVTARPHVAAGPAARSGNLGTGLRLGLLFGPTVFGVTAAGVALPQVVAALHVSPDAVSWVLTVHALALGVATALFGRLADAWGVRVTLALGALLLLGGAAIALVAPSLGVLVAGRAVLASGSGAMAASALTLAASVDGSRRGAVLTSFGAVVATFAGGATLAGGLVTELLSWRLTLVLPALSLAGVAAALPHAPRRGGSRERVDAVGAGQLALAAGAALVLIQSPALDLRPSLLAAVAAVGALAAAGLTRRVRRLPGAFVPRSLVAGPAFGAAALTGAGVFCGLFAAMYAVPQLLADRHGWSVLAIGAALLPGALAGALLSRLAGRVSPPAAGRRLLGGVTVAFALLLGAAGLADGTPALVVAAVALGFAAFALTQVVLTDAVSAQVPAAQRGAAVGLLNLAFMTGGAVGTAAAGALAGPLGLTGALALVALLPLAAGALAARGGARP